MKLDLKQPELSIRNEYTLQLFDEDNNLLQEVKCHNAASSKRFIEYCMLGYNVYYPTHLYLALGSGTGTINIEEAQHKLFKQTFASSSTIAFQKINKEPSFINNHYQASITFPPTTSYVGALTEIGIVVSSSSGYCISHSLLADAEGNPIVIKKTSTNILIVKVDMFVSVSLPNQPYNFKYFPAWASSLAGMWYDNLNRGYGYMYPNTQHIWEIGEAGFPYTLIKYLYLSPYYCGEELEQENILKYPVPIMTDTTYNNYMYLQLTWEEKELPLTAKTLNRRWDTNDNNISFAHSIVIPGFGAIALPNHEICPPYEYKNIVVGTGDGNSRTFLPYINEVVSAIGYVNGEVSESTFINFDPRKSPLWNKCIKLVANTDEYEIPSYQLTEEYPYGDSSKSRFLGMYYACCPALLSEKTHAKTAPGINSRNGSYYIYYDEQGISLDHARFGGSLYYRDSTSYYYNNQSVTLFYSNDGEQWTQATKIEQSYITYYFPRITANYWKIFFGPPNKNYDDSIYRFLATFSTAEQWDKNQYTQRGMDPKFFVAGDSQEFDFGKCGITFTTPPPEGTTITMDAILDLPYKDTDIIMTMTVEAEQPNPNEVTV